MAAPHPQDPYGGGDAFIFVSYSREDRDVVAEDIAMLQEEGFRVWYDQKIRSGEKWLDDISRRIEECCQVIAFLSPAAVQSGWIHSEVLLAKGKGKPIIPVLLESFELPPKAVLLLGDAQYLQRAAATYRNDLLGGLDPRACESDYHVDARLLGLGALPTLADIGAGKLAVDEATERQRRRELADAYQREKVNAYPVDNVFQLTSSRTRAGENLLGVEVQPRPDRPTNLLSRPLHLRTAYVSPLRLLTGLVTRLDDNWPPIVEAYSTLAGERQGGLDDFHYFVEFCWLSWGPSVDTSPPVEDPATRFMVAQVAFGDEANSLPLIVEKGRWRRVFEGWRKGRASGWPLTLENLLVVNPGRDSYFAELLAVPLLQDLFDGGVALYFSDRSRAEPTRDPDAPFYSTAYAWLMLEAVQPLQAGDDASIAGGACTPPERLAPGSALPFFEHANLASKRGLEFLLRCLARKALGHVLQCAVEPDYRAGGYYRYATALFADPVAEVLREEIGRLSPAERLVVDRRLYVPPPGQWRNTGEVVALVKALHEAVTEACRRSLQGH